jgi:hypothetical protein
VVAGLVVPATVLRQPSPCWKSFGANVHSLTDTAVTIHIELVGLSLYSFDRRWLRAHGAVND